MKRLKQIFLVLVMIYVVIGVVFYFIQESIIFNSKPLPLNHTFSFNQSYEEINLPFNKGNLNIIKFKPKTHRKGIVLFFHGNTDNVEHYKKYPFFFLKNNYEIWMMDYPGFGKSTGKRSEKIIDSEALFFYELALKETSEDSIIVYGKSLGTGIASFLASNRKCKQLILECPYYSLTSLAKHFAPIYPVRFMLNYSFPTHEYLSKINVPITIFHGTNDELIPYKHSKWLKQENDKINLVTIEKGRHNDLSNFILYQSTLDSLLQH